MSKINQILILLLLSLTGCESLVTTIPDKDLPKTKPQLVVQSFISPQGQRIIVVVTESRPLFGEQPAGDGIVRNAEVTISDGANSFIIPFDANNNFYTVDRTRFVPKPGATYEIKATDNVRVARGTCTVPAQIIVPRSFVIDTLYSGGFGNADTSLALRVTWDDMPGERNFYRVRASIDLDYSVPDGSIPGEIKEKRVRNRFNFNWEETLGRENFRSDANLDGASFTSPRGELNLPRAIYYDFGNGKSAMIYPKTRIASVNMELYNTDENYYKYHQSLDASRNSENPFVEPSPVFTNIEGGLGCFAAYSVGQLVYRPK